MAILFTFPGYEALGERLRAVTGAERGALLVRRFPDGETFVQIQTEMRGRDILLLCGLDRADEKIMALLFFAETAREMGAARITLIAPYLGYMRQDKRFHEGEAVTSTIFAAFLSRHIDRLITIDPHLHRHKTLSEIYTVPAEALHAGGVIAQWIRRNVQDPVLIGPDEESDQWVSEVAKKAGAPFTVLTKIRHGDREVEVSVPQLERYKERTPVLVDDIISTARTMIETIRHLARAGMRPPVCIGIHAVFAGDACRALENAGAARIVTCNTIPHPSNAIDIAELLGFVKERGGEN